MLTTTLRRRAARAETAGDFAAAVSAWTEVARRRDAPAVEEHLADLRIATVADAVAGPTPTLASPPDPFPGIVGTPPEVSPSAVDAAVLGGALHHHGCLLVRNLLSRTAADELAATVERAFAAREAMAGDERDAPWFAPCREWDARAGGRARMARQWAEQCATMQVVDSPRALRLVADALVGTGLVAAVTDYLGERPVLSVNKTTLRRIPPTPARPGIRTGPSWAAKLAPSTSGLRSPSAARAPMPPACT